MQGTYLGVYPAKVCEYWTEKPQKSNCKFCSVGLNLGVDDADEKSVDEVMEVIRAARAESGITYVDFNTGHYEGDTYLDILEPYIRRIKKEVGILVGVQTPPHPDLSRYDALREMGVNRVSFCFEIYDPASSRKSARARTASTASSATSTRSSTARSSGRRDPGTSPGSPTARSSSASSRPSPRSRPSTGSPRWARSRRSACSVRWPAPTTPTCPPPQTEHLIPVFRRLYEACMEQGLPVGVAPNIHVSLVLLPDECRSLSDRSYPLQTLKLKLLGQAAKLMLNRNIRTAEGRAKSGAIAAA